MEISLVHIVDTEGCTRWVPWKDVQPLLAGKNGLNDFELAKEGGYPGTVDEWLAGLKGPRGYNNYELAQQEGFTGTLPEYLDSLKGKPGEPLPAAKPNWVTVGPHGKEHIVNGNLWKLQSPNKPYSAMFADNVDFDWYRFESQEGDVSLIPSDQTNILDGKKKERVEEYMKTMFPFNKSIYVEFEIFIEPGGDIVYKLPEYGCYIFQLHSTEQKVKTNVKPPVLLKLSGQGDLTLMYTGDKNAAPTKYAPQFSPVTVKVKRGEWVKIQMRILGSLESKGELDLIVNGVQVYGEKKLLLGVPDDNFGYVKRGVYKVSLPTVVAVQYKNYKISLDKLF